VHAYVGDEVIVTWPLSGLRDLGVIKRVAGTYRYYLTRIGRAATAAICCVTQTVIIPALA
jgi:hypothetical protein